MTPAAVPPELLQQLIASAAEWTGFRTEAILRQAVVEVASGWLRRRTLSQLAEAMRSAEPALVHDVCQAVSVGETYFFRTPDQLTTVLERLTEPLQRGPVVRAWSAGCATGEEPYTLSALLAAAAGGGVEVEVLGTDLVARSLELARAARYGRWSVRRQTALAPAFHPLGDGRVEVDAAVRRRVTFAQHNLLDAAPQAFGHFDLILCRNVLVYFSRAAAAQAVGNLTERLSADGLLVFGAMDLTEVPAGLERSGPAELQFFRRLGAAPDLPVALKAVRPQRVVRRLADQKGAATATPAKPLAAPAVAVALAEPVALHLEILARVEGGDLDAADKLLDGLLQQDPGYLPGLLERALLHLRLGERSSGERLMRELLTRSERREADELLAAPEPITIAFLRASAAAALKGTR